MATFQAMVASHGAARTRVFNVLVCLQLLHVVGRRQLEDAADAAEHGLVEVLRPVGGEEDDAVEALDLGEQLGHLGRAAVAALLEELLEERLASAISGARSLMGAKQAEQSKQAGGAG